MPAGLAQAASKDGTGRCNFSTVPLVKARNAGEKDCRPVHSLSASVGPSYLGGSVDHQSG